MEADVSTDGPAEMEYTPCYMLHYKHFMTISLFSLKKLS